MKKSKSIKLVLITAALASCHQQKKEGRKVYMRSDTTANYSRVNTQNDNENGGGGSSSGGHSTWYYAFRPYGYYSGGGYTRYGFYSSGISEHSNIGSNSFKGVVSRGGFGGEGVSVSS